MKAIRRRDTPYEVALRSELHRHGYRFKVDASPVPGRRRADIVFTRKRVAVYVDGCFWHGCPQHAIWPRANADWWRTKIRGNVERDRATTSELLARGWRVVRVWDHQPLLDACAQVLAVLEGAPEIA